MDTDDLPKVNELWHFVYKLFYWRLSTVETLIEWLHEAWNVHSCLFHIKTSKEEGTIVLTRATCCSLNWGVYTVICWASSKSVKTTIIVWISWKKDIIWKMRLCFLSKVITYKTVRFQWNFTRAVVQHSCIYSVHMRNKTKDPYAVPNIFDMNTCTVIYWHYTNKTVTMMS